MRLFIGFIPMKFWLLLPLQPTKNPSNLTICEENRHHVWILTQFKGPQRASEVQNHCLKWVPPAWSDENCFLCRSTGLHQWTVEFAINQKRSFWRLLSWMLCCVLHDSTATPVKPVTVLTGDHFSSHTQILRQKCVCERLNLRYLNQQHAVS